jgi:hypothetical protein
MVRVLFTAPDQTPGNPDTYCLCFNNRERVHFLYGYLTPMRIFRRTPHSSSLIHVHCEYSIKPFVQERNLSSWSTAFFHQMSILAKGNDGTGRIRKNVLLILIRQESSEILIFERINSSNAARNCSSLLIPIDSRRFLFAYSSSIRIAVYFAFRCFSRITSW